MFWLSISSLSAFKVGHFEWRESGSCTSYTWLTETPGQNAAIMNSASQKCQCTLSVRCFSSSWASNSSKRNFIKLQTQVNSGCTQSLFFLALQNSSALIMSHLFLMWMSIIGRSTGATTNWDDVVWHNMPKIIFSSRCSSYARKALWGPEKKNYFKQLEVKLTWPVKQN